MARAKTPWSIKQRDEDGKVWQITVDVPRVEGEPRRQRSITVRGTRAAAERRAPSFHAEVQREGVKKKPSAQTVGDYLEEWLATAVVPHNRPNTIRNYRMSVDWLTPHIGNIRLTALRPLDIERAYNALRESGRKGKRSEATIALIHEHLGCALRRAVSWGLISHSPLDGVQAPKSDSVPRQTLTQDQARKLVAVIREHPQRVRLILAIGMGMRVGEVLALQWRDIDLDALAKGQPCVATIRRSWSDAAQAYGPTKSGKERRAAVPEVVAEILREELLRQEEKRNMDPEWNPDGLIACGDTGRPVRHGMSKFVRRCCREAGVPEVVYHGLRHTIATLRLDAGENPATVADELGHDPAVLMRIYAHIHEQALIESAKRTDGLLR